MRQICPGTVKRPPSRRALHHRHSHQSEPPRVTEQESWLCTDTSGQSCGEICVRGKTHHVAARMSRRYPTLPCLIRQLHGTARGVLLSGGQGYQHVAYLLPARRVYRAETLHVHRRRECSFASHAQPVPPLAPCNPSTPSSLLSISCIPAWGPNVLAAILPFLTLPSPPHLSLSLFHPPPPPPLPLPSSSIPPRQRV
ncbi:hypothetical protein D5F01_LYC19052 [Larimichthys crocea]|uniref:Uncharacterized protein n=1 Tax=Larimichthys crocea TaxID=215358 RepID=A0A6G0HWP4_LARCR|nr:hypothetical protein D5F01_LYC19052 [Larimichthys crocea]